jgi:hypothetical protein
VLAGLLVVRLVITAEIMAILLNLPRLLLLEAAVVVERLGVPL